MATYTIVLDKMNSIDRIFKDYYQIQLIRYTFHMHYILYKLVYFRVF